MALILSFTKGIPLFVEIIDMAAKVAPKNVGEAINGRELFAVNPQMTLTQALSLMLNKGIHRTPVVL